MKRTALIRHLEGHGCVLLREGAKHSRYINLADTSRISTVPRHTEIADLLARKICRQLRRKLVEDYELLAVVSLPAGVFKPYAGVKTAILVFRRPIDEKAQKANKIWFYEVWADGYDPDKITGGGRPETPERNDIPDLLKQWAAYKASGLKKPPGVEAGTLLDPGSEDPRCWWLLINKIAENDYNLAAGRYKPNQSGCGSSACPPRGRTYNLPLA